MKDLKTTAISILDLASYPLGKDIADAFVASVDLAQHAETWGYKRYWLAEHHNIVGIASAATSVMIGHIAGKTKSIQVGSGGIMLPNHAPYIIAEQFGTLATLYPNRIDLGLGRAPGTDPVTTRAVRGPGGLRGSEFPELIEELLFYFTKAEVGQKVRAIPGEGIDVPIWILGSSLFSAELAARLGRPYAFAGHFAPQLMLPALELYRRHFRPSEALAQPHVMVGVPVVAADTDSQAQYLSTSLYQTFLNLVRGTFRQTPPPVDDMNALWNPAEEQAVKSMMQTLVCGGPETVRAGLDKLIAQTQADELIITSALFEHRDRLHSYEVIANLKGWDRTAEVAAF